MGFCSTLKYKHCEQHSLSHVFVRFTYHNFLSQQVLPQMADDTAECRSASMTEIRPRYIFCIIRQILDFPTHLYTAEAWFSLLFQADLNYIFSGGSGSSACWPCRARLGQRHVRAQHWAPLWGQHRSRGAPSHFESQESYFGSVPSSPPPRCAKRGLAQSGGARGRGGRSGRTRPGEAAHSLLLSLPQAPAARQRRPSPASHMACSHLIPLSQTLVRWRMNSRIIKTEKLLWTMGWFEKLRNTAFEVPTFSGFLVCSSPAWVIWWRCHKLADRFVVTKPVFSFILSSLHFMQKKFLGHVSIPHATSQLIIFTCRIS